MAALIQSLISYFKFSVSKRTNSVKQTPYYSLILYSSSHYSSAPHRSPIASLLLSNKPLEAAKILHESTSKPLPPILYNSTLAALSGNGLVSPACKLFDRMLERKIKFNDVGFGCFVKILCRFEGLDKILSLIGEVKGTNCEVNGSIAAVMIVDGFCRAAKIEEAWTSLGELRMIGWKPDFIAYRVVSEGFRLANRTEEAGRILKQKRKFGVAPRLNDYREFILSLISESRLCEAKELGEAIVYGDFLIDDDVLDSLIGSVSNVDPGSAALLLKYMIDKDRYFPDIALLRHLSTNFSKAADSNEMWDLFRTLSGKGCFSGVEQYNVMVAFLCKVGKLREAYDVLKEMKRNGFPPDIFSYNCLMEACCREDFLRPAKKLWDEMFANGCCANLRTYNILIRKLLEEGEVEEAQNLFNHMTGKGISPDDVTYKMLIRALCQEKKVEGAVEIFNKSVRQDSIIAKSTLCTLILALCKEGYYVPACNIMCGLPSSIEDSDSHVILLKSLTDAGEIETAIKHIKWIKTNSPFKAQTVLTELFASLSIAPKLEPVLKLLRLMHVQGLVSNNDPWMKMLEGDLLFN